MAITSSGVNGIYKIEVYNVDGEFAGYADDILSVEIKLNINSVSPFNIRINPDLDIVDLMEIDGQIKVYRRVPIFDSSFSDVPIISGFIRSKYERVEPDGERVMQVYCRDWNEILNSRIIAYKSGTIRATKDNYADTVMKEYVRENAGVDATETNGRLADGVWPGFYIDSNLNSGPTWSGSAAYDNLLDTVAKVAEETGTEFRVEQTGPTQWIFKVYLSGIGENKTRSDINSFTGKNKYGNFPVLFSIPLNTVGRMDRTVSHIDEANRVFGLGQGEQSLRTVLVREYEDSVNRSPYALREQSRNGSSNEFEYQLEAFIYKWLDELKFQNSVTFEPVQQKSSAFGYQYNLGDIVTVKFREEYFDMKIKSVHITLSGSSEKIETTLEQKDYL